MGVIRSNLLFFRPKKTIILDSDEIPGKGNRGVFMGVNDGVQKGHNQVEFQAGAQIDQSLQPPQDTAFQYEIGVSYFPTSKLELGVTGGITPIRYTRKESVGTQIGWRWEPFKHIFLQPTLKAGIGKLVNHSIFDRLPNSDKEDERIGLNGMIAFINPELRVFCPFGSPSIHLYFGVGFQYEFRERTKATPSIFMNGEDPTANRNLLTFNVGVAVGAVRSR